MQCLIDILCVNIRGILTYGGQCERGIEGEEARNEQEGKLRNFLTLSFGIGM